jgi:hypothetical protein
MQKNSLPCLPELHIREAAGDDVPAILHVYSEAGIQDESFTPEEGENSFGDLHPIRVTSCSSQLRARKPSLHTL